MFTFGESIECAPTRVLAGTTESWKLWISFCKCNKLFNVFVYLKEKFKHLSVAFVLAHPGYMRL